MVGDLSHAVGRDTPAVACSRLVKVSRPIIPGNTGSLASRGLGTRAQCLPQIHIPQPKAPASGTSSSSVASHSCSDSTSVSHDVLAFGLRVTVFGRLARFVDGTACPVLFSFSCIFRECDSGTVSARSGSCTGIEQRLRLLFWRHEKTGAIRKPSARQLQLQSNPFQAHDPFLHNLPMSASGQVPTSKSFIQSVMRKFAVGLLQDLPRHLKAISPQNPWQFLLTAT